MRKATETDSRAYSIYYDGDDAVKIITVNLQQYTPLAVNKETVILRKKDDAGVSTDTIAVWDHDAKEIGTFDIGANELPL